MGKNNSKGKLKRKTSAVFKVAGDKSLKVKGKAKKVNTNLRKMSFKTKEQTETCDKQLKELKGTMYASKKKNSQPTSSESKPRKEKPEPVDIDETVMEIQRLWQ